MFCIFAYRFFARSHTRLFKSDSISHDKSYFHSLLISPLMNFYCTAAYLDYIFLFAARLNRKGDIGHPWLIPQPISNSNWRRLLGDFVAAAFLHDRNVLQGWDKAWEESQRFWVVLVVGSWGGWQ